MLRSIALLIVALQTAMIVAAEPVAYPDHRQLMVVRDETGALQPITTAQQWMRRRNHILQSFQAVAGELPARDKLPPLDVQISEDVDLGNVRRLKLTFVSEVVTRGGEPAVDRVPAYLLLPKKENVRLPAILALHQTTPEGKAEPCGVSGKKNLNYGLELAQRGYVVLAPDYPSFGDYQYNFDDDSHASGTIKGIWNHMRCVDLLQTRPEVDADRIGAIGHSLGGHNALFVGAFDERIKAVVTNCGWTPFHDYYGGKLAGWAGPRYMPRIRDVYSLDADRVPVDFAELIGAIAPRAVLSISPLHDDNFAVDGVRKGIVAARDVFKLLGADDKLAVEYPDCAHDFPPAQRELAYAFLDKALHNTNAESRAKSDDYSDRLKRVPPHEPAAALATFELHPEFEIQQVAAEPNVASPVAISFDEDGRLFVVEMRDYPESSEEKLGRVRLLEDKDNDGRFETSTVFAEGLSWPTSVICYGGGVFVAAAPDIIYLKDTNGDGKADERKVVFTGFGRSNVQGLVNSLTWGVDNRIHGATSSSGAQVVRSDRPNEKPLALSGRDFAFDPRTLEIEATSGGGQHGLTFDDWGHKFVCSNSDHLQAVLMEERYLARNPLVQATARESIAADGPQAPVFRASPVEAWRVLRTELRVAGKVPGPIEGGGKPAGYFTGATGVMVYRGHGWPERYRGQVFVGDVGSNLMHRKSLSPRGASWAGERLEKETEFLRSTDVWFRPVGFANAPDGTLYVMDMYREVIEHPASLPPEIKKHLDLTSGRERGRIYRIVPRGFKQPEATRLGKRPAAELVGLLEHPGGWQQDAAARLLYQLNDADTAPALRKLVHESKSPHARLRALSLLKSFNVLDANTCLAALGDAHPGVREQAVRLCEYCVNSKNSQKKELIARLCSLADDPDARVRFQVALSLGEVHDDGRYLALARLARRDAGEPHVTTAILTSVGEGTPVMVRALLDAPGADGDVRPELLSQLVGMISRKGDRSEIRALVELVTGLRADQPLRLSLALELARGLRRGQPRSDVRRRLGELTGKPGEQLFDWLSETAIKVSLTPDAAPLVQQAAIETLALIPWQNAEACYRALLMVSQPPDLQILALKSLAQHADEATGELIIEACRQLGPTVKPSAVDALLSSTAGSQQLLAALESGAIAKADVDAQRRRLLEAHPNESIRKRAVAVFGATPARKEIVEKYRGALAMKGDRSRGQKVFQTSCTACHRVGDIGHEVGPSLAAAMSRGAESVLVNVLDPNREVNPQFLNYIALTKDGRTANGMVVAESAGSVTLRRGEGASETILRSDIEELRSTGVSLMPEGLEQQVDLQSFADLIEFLNSAVSRQ